MLGQQPLRLRDYSMGRLASREKSLFRGRFGMRRKTPEAMLQKVQLLAGSPCAKILGRSKRGRKSNGRSHNRQYPGQPDVAAPRGDIEGRGQRPLPADLD